MVLLIPALMVAWPVTRLKVSQLIKSAAPGWANGLLACLAALSSPAHWSNPVSAPAVATEVANLFNIGAAAKVFEYRREVTTVQHHGLRCLSCQRGKGGVGHGRGRGCLCTQ